MDRREVGRFQGLDFDPKCLVIFQRYLQERSLDLRHRTRALLVASHLHFRERLEHLSKWQAQLSFIGISNPADENLGHLLVNG